MQQLGRPKSPGFTVAQADSFRRIFSNQRASLRVPNKAISQAIDDFEIGSNADSCSLLQNAFAAKRRLTHRVARIIVAGLILADGDPIPARVEKQKLALTALGGALYAYRAWDPDPAVAAFIPFEAIESLADNLSAGRPAARRLIIQKLRAEVPAMGRAWCERMRRTPIKGATPRILELVSLMEGMVRSEITAFYPESPASSFYLGPEFDILHRERPHVTEYFLEHLARAHSIDGR